MINFVNIYALFGLLALPAIFFIMKFYPPNPERMEFSSFFILNNIIKKNTAKTKFPLWLLIFRILLCFLIILFFSKPFLTINTEINKYENFVIIADNGWSISSNWQNYKNIIKEISLEAEKNKKEIHFYYSSSKEFEKPNIFKSHNEVIDFLNNKPPLASQITRENFFEYLKLNNYFKESKVFFIFSSLDSFSLTNQTKNLNQIKKNNSSIQIINPIKRVTFIDSFKIEKENLAMEINRKGSYLDNNFILQFIGEKGDLILEKKYTFLKNSNKFQINEKFPVEIINQFFLIKILNENHAGAVFYLDDYRKKLPVGIIVEEGFTLEKPLLSPIYYLKKVLTKSRLVFTESLTKILEKEVSVIFLPSNEKLSQSDFFKLKEWVDNGGVLIRFSDKKIKDQRNIFLEEKKALSSIRNIGKDLSIQNNISITPFHRDSLFSSLNIPNDLQFNKQLILENFNSDIITLASLEDQSPLISMKYVGEGKVILFHVTSNSEWSNLPLSSLFEDLIEKLLLISRAEKPIFSQEMKMKYKINSNGELAIPKKNYFINYDSNEKIIPSYLNPIGVYENNNLSIALNLSGNLKTEGFFKNTNMEIEIRNNYKKSVVELKNFILCLVFIMFLIDMLISIILKNKILFLDFFKRRKAFSILFIFPILITLQNDLEANEQYNNLFLAYIKTENNLLNQIALSGLTELSSFLIERTSLNPKGVKEVDLLEEEIFFYPLIYWQITNLSPNFNEKTLKKVKSYFDSGGIILFDIIDYSKSYTSINSNSIEEIKNLFYKFGIENLQKIPKNHTLTKSYYLLNKFPGRWDNRVLLVQSDDLESKDGVSSAIIGLNDWAGAWAKDKENYPLYQVVPGGERQRELSYRFGINLLMYALTGSYKSDQVHSKSILERLRKE